MTLIFSKVKRRKYRVRRLSKLRGSLLESRSKILPGNRHPFWKNGSSNTLIIHTWKMRTAKI